MWYPGRKVKVNRSSQILVIGVTCCYNEHNDIIIYRGTQRSIFQNISYSTYICLYMIFMRLKAVKEICYCDITLFCKCQQGALKNRYQEYLPARIKIARKNQHLRIGKG